MQEVQGQIVQAGLQPFVRLAGFREDLEQLLPCLDVLVHPADKEGLGVTLLQAAASGVPIVASAAGGMPEVVKDGFNGYLVPPGDAEAIACAVLRLLEAPEQAKTLGRQGRTLVQAEFSLSAMVQGNLQVYRGLVQGWNGRAGSG
jgi:glycosyltransferase involved in cell wall biosynthesis